MKLRNPTHPLRSRTQESSSEMQCTRFLAKPRPRDNTNACRIEQAKAIEFVRSMVRFLGSLNGFGWDMDSREEVHRSLFVLAWNMREANRQVVCKDRT